MSKWNVSMRIWLGFAGVVLTMAVFGAQIYRHISNVQQDIEETATDAWPGLYSVTQIDSEVKTIYGLLNRYVMDTDGAQTESDLERIQTNWESVGKALHSFEQTVNTDSDRQAFNKVTGANSDAEAAYRVLLNSAKNKREQQLQTFRDRVEPAFAALFKAIGEAVEQEKRAGDVDMKTLREEVGDERIDVLWSLALPLVLASVIGYLLVRAVNRPLVAAVSAMQASGTQINTSAMEIAATSQQQLATANEIAATTAEVGATSKQISSTSNDLMQTVKSVTEIAERTAVLATNGQAGLARMKTTMQQIVDASASINERLSVLSEKAGNIGTVVTTITKVADQTNLLSLNAAIEAEKAGEHGRGFAVVATEIRRLADQSALATGDIEQIVKEIQSAVSAGVMGMDRFSEEVRRGGGAVQQVSDELSQIIQQVQTLTPSFEAVEEGMQSQTMGAQQITEALAQLGEASRQTVESLRQSNMAIEQLNAASRILQEGVTKFSMVTA